MIFRCFIIIIVLLTSGNSIACSCVGRPSVKESIKKSDVVFVGKILGEERVFMGDTAAALLEFGNEFRDSISKYQSSESGYRRLSLAGIRSQKKYTLKVVQFYKGKFKEEIIDIFTGNGGGDCGIRFLKNEEYIIYGYKVNFKKEDVTYLSSGITAPTMFHTNICTRTRKMDNGELNQIQKIRKLKFVSEQ
jgi:hypothetical protein